MILQGPFFIFEIITANSIWEFLLLAVNKLLKWPFEKMVMIAINESSSPFAITTIYLLKIDQKWAIIAIINNL